VYGKPFPRFFCCPGGRFNVFPVTGKGAKIVGDYEGKFPGKGDGQEQDRGRNTRFPQFYSLVYSSHGQVLDACFESRQGDRDSPMAIGISLDRQTDEGARPDFCTDRSDIPAETVKMNNCPGSSHKAIVI
jgi:hypothetical protein